MNRRTLVFSLTLAAATIVGLTASGVPAVAGDRPTTLRFLDTNPRSTDLDLGKRGGSAGDMQVFVNDLVRNGNRIGQIAGSCQVALFTETRLVVHCSSTATFRDGSLTLQGAFSENPAVGLQRLRFAVTGGTGRYRGAAGEATGEVIPDTNNIQWTVRLD
jgi:hypothetical protein